MKNKYIVNLIKIFVILYIIIYPLVPIDNTIGAIHFNPDYILYTLFLVIIGGCLVNKKFRKNVKSDIWNFLKSPLSISLLCLNAIMYLSTIYAMQKKVAFTQSIRFSMYIFIFFILSYILKDKRIMDRILKICFSISLLVSSFAIYQFIHNKFFTKTIVENFRVGSFLQNSNNLGAYLIFFVFISINMIFISKDRKKKILYTLATMIILSGIILCGSRNALLALMFGIFILILCYDKKYMIWGVLLVALLIMVPISRNRIVQVFDMKQNASRVKIWKTSIYMIKDKPILGIGYENFYEAYPTYFNKHKKELYVSLYYRPLHPHNMFLKFQTEIGILGTVSIIIFLAISLRLIIRVNNKFSNKVIKAKLKSLGISFVVFQVMNLLDCYYGIPKLMVTMFIFLGIINFYERAEINEG